MWCDVVGIQCRYPWKATQRYVVLWAFLHMGFISDDHPNIPRTHTQVYHQRWLTPHKHLCFVCYRHFFEDGNPYEPHLVVRKTFLEVVEVNTSGKGLAGGRANEVEWWLQGLTSRHSDAKQNWRTKHGSWKKISEETYIHYIINDHSWSWMYLIYSDISYIMWYPAAKILYLIFERQRQTCSCSAP